jgi:hypothetical protein
MAPRRKAGAAATAVPKSKDKQAQPTVLEGAANSPNKGSFFVL